VSLEVRNFHVKSNISHNLNRLINIINSRHAVTCKIIVSFIVNYVINGLKTAWYRIVLLANISDVWTNQIFSIAETGNGLAQWNKVLVVVCLFCLHKVKHSYLHVL